MPRRRVGIWRDAVLLDPRVLISRDRLVGQLAPDPIGLLGQDNLAAEPAVASAAPSPPLTRATPARS